MKRQAIKNKIISIIIPVYHEEKNIKRIFEAIEKHIRNSHEILVIYDDISDPTIHAIKKYQTYNKGKNIYLIRNNFGNRKGAMNAIKTGFINAKGETIVVVMADLADDITQIDHMYSLIQQGNDIVCASRFMKGGKKIGGPILKSILSRTACVTLYAFFHVPTHDATNAFKMYRTAIFNDIKIESKGGFEYSLEIILKAWKKGYKITEIPTVWKDREEGNSNFKLRQWLPEYIKWFLFAFKN